MRESVYLSALPERLGNGILSPADKWEMKKEGREKRDQEGTHSDAKYFSRKKELNEVPVCK